MNTDLLTVLIIGPALVTAALGVIAGRSWSKGAEEASALEIMASLALAIFTVAGLILFCGAVASGFMRGVS